MQTASGMAPIGIFDSGIGGLSVLQALRAALPHEPCIYVADSGHAPYGERGDAFVQQRCAAIADYLLKHHAIKLLVVACNTATAAAIGHLRALWPQLPLVGVEPAIKPAALQTGTGHVGVIATRGTVGSSRFQNLLHTHGQQVHWHVQACDGLAQAIEASTWQADGNLAEIEALCARYISALGPFGPNSGHMDTLVLRAAPTTCLPGPCCSAWSARTYTCWTPAKPWPSKPSACCSKASCLPPRHRAPPLRPCSFSPQASSRHCKRPPSAGWACLPTAAA